MIRVQISVLAILIYIIGSEGASIPCSPLEFNASSIVCRCNATYCDTVEPITKLAKGTIAQYTTTKDGLRFAKTLQKFTPQNETADLVFTINRGKSFQSIIGFGGAFTDSTGINIKSLTPPAQDNLLKSYFSTEGIEYNVGRIPIASCDFSTRIYSYADTPGDFDLKHFFLQEEDLKYKIPLIKRAQSMSDREIHLFGSPWAAPGWMKTNGNMTGGGYLKGKPGEQYYKTWANYFVRFLQEYEKQNITLWGLTAENEPTEGQMVHYSFQCLAFTAELQRDFISEDLGPALHAAGYKDIKLMILDDQRLMLPAWPKTVLLSNSSSAAKYVSGIGVHWYMDSWVPAVHLDQTHDALPDYFILGTEACNGRPVELGSWEKMEKYTHDIIEDLNHWVTGWTDWNMALNEGGGPNWVGNFVDAPIIVNAAKDEFYKQPMYYGLGHFSKFLPRDSLRIDAPPSVKTSLETVAFLTKEGATVLIVSNSEDHDIAFSVKDPHFGTAHLTSARRSIQTFIWWY